MHPRTVARSWPVLRRSGIRAQVEARRLDRQPCNPLFARVMVNRVWHYHFGSGLVKNPNDFGFNGGTPSHPELLDWLAQEFIRGGWSLKKLHKLILMSQSYQQSSEFVPEAAEKDADNRLLWRYAPMRLPGEAVRDAMLAVSGQLNPSMYGPSFRPFNIIKNTGSYHSYEPVDSAEPDQQRRTIYRMNVNSGGNPLLDALDCPGAFGENPSAVYHHNASTIAQPDEQRLRAAAGESSCGAFVNGIS